MTAEATAQTEIVKTVERLIDEAIALEEIEVQLLRSVFDGFFTAFALESFSRESIPVLGGAATIEVFQEYFDRAWAAHANTRDWTGLLEWIVRFKHFDRTHPHHWRLKQRLDVLLGQIALSGKPHRTSIRFALDGGAESSTPTGKLEIV